MNVKRTILYVLGAVLLVGGGAIAYFVFTNINQKPAQEVEQTSNVEVPQIQENSDEALKTGQFVDGDAVHSGQGEVTINESQDGPVLVFGSDFKVTNGPDLFVYLSPNKAGESLGQFASLGELKSPEGEQVYNLPDNYEDYQTVVIWCRAFSVTFATAELN